jgi:hypothetical protein
LPSVARHDISRKHDARISCRVTAPRVFQEFNMISVPFRGRGVLRQRAAVFGATLLAIAGLGTASFAVAVAAPNDQATAAIVLEQAAPPVFEAFEPFEATGLPAGSARGIPQIANFPPGFSLKHVHGGPSYVYLLQGSLDIVHADGTSVTYTAGEFFWEPVGRTHTARTSDGARAFVLRFLTPGAEATIPAQ